MTESKLDPLTILKEDLQDEDHSIQIEGAKRLVVIAKAIGPQRTRKDLVEFLDGYLKQENDEALVAIGKQMVEVSKYVGGNEYVGCLVPLMEKLIFQEETVVCDAAAESMADVISEMGSGDVEKVVIPSLEKMATAEWFQPRVGVCKLLPKAYPKAGESSQEKIVKWFSSLCKDENPMVKKAALLNMGGLSNVMGKNKIRDTMIAKLKEVCAEDSDLMRLHAVEICKELTKTFDDTKEFVATLWPVVQKLGEDSSWRVRKALANTMPDFAKTVGSAMAAKDLLPIYLALLKDKEAETKIAACTKLLEMCTECKKPSVAQVAPILRELIEDANQTVRATVSSSLGELAAMSDNKTTEGQIFDVMKVAVKDEDPQVRCNTLEAIEKVAKSLKSAASTLLGVLQPSSSDPKWRVRREYLRASTAFATAGAGSTAENEGYEEKLASNLVECLSDHISAIREEACVQLAVLVKIKGGEWGVAKLLPEALKSVSQSEMADQSNYITRMTGLILVQNISQHLTTEQIETHVAGFVEQCLKDAVENVRFKAARTASTIIPLVSKKCVRERLVPSLEAVQKGEQDSDILFYAEQALHIATKYS
mmetsp:Transcript_21115/g.42490  ORF Transcript_21115/g.42490 Transcript_21115/m.42490 type:complete len:594 (-) Transcript_21115:265-2046(-)|eukprot:CAMPEP_0167786334 /NCGR_PEP_ID=MMETSP0111_2-20121227/8727_1 /TAXON_ID=91324 /ORGANISM="Lotharella globosa, Strain CCCM811" /LENGTH=593 /DNA_ID=CAMNT_0007677689 /DNA_START=57 /DNA_END=1838 /DNA_ORIENTATION=-